MDESLTTDGPATAATGGDSTPLLPPGVDPDAPPHVRAAATAYFTELDELLAHLDANPAERWVAYYGGRRIGFGSNHPEFYRGCQEQFPDGRFRIYTIDAADKCPEDTVV